jgi:hypothetical protein
LSLGLPEQREVIVGNRILVLLAQKLLFDEHLESRRIRAGELPLEHPDRVRDLLAPEHEFCFLLAPGHLFPHGHRDRHHHGQDQETDDQGRHGVAGLCARSPAFSVALTS